MIADNTTTEEPKVLQEIIINLSDVEEESVIEEYEVEQVIETKFSKVICHQCGSLFSNTNSDCKTFDPNDPRQEGFCDEGQVYFSTFFFSKSTHFPRSVSGILGRKRQVKLGVGEYHKHAF